jgi:hypothetical protein
MVYLVKVTVSLFENLQKWLAITLRRFRRSLLNNSPKRLFIVIFNRIVRCSAVQYGVVCPRHRHLKLSAQRRNGGIAHRITNRVRIQAELSELMKPVSTILPVTCVEPAMLAVGAKITANYQV